jgi:IS66 Orf2 like protein
MIGAAGVGAGGVRVWLATAAVDGRKGFDTLCGIVRQSLSHDPLCGDLLAGREAGSATMG